MLIWIEDIYIHDRIRKNYGDLTALAESINTHGLINPITVMQNGDRYVLIAGFRRLVATKMAGKDYIEANILTARDAEEQLRLEIEENENRKDFTHSERIEYAMRLQAVERAKARKRMGRTEVIEDNYSYGRSRDIIAKRVGYSSGRQLERAIYVAQNRPDLMELVDKGDKTVSAAYAEAKGITRKPKTSELELDAESEFVLNEVMMATDIFVARIELAASHYKQIQQTDARSEFVLKAIDQASQLAKKAFKASIDG